MLGAGAQQQVMAVIESMGVRNLIVESRPSPDQQAATEFFTTATRNLVEAGERAGVRRLVVVSIIGIDKFTAGYSAAKLDHERAMLAGPIPARVLRAAQFHEFVGQLLDWSTRGDVAYLPRMRTQLVAAGDDDASGIEDPETGECDFLRLADNRH